MTKVFWLFGRSGAGKTTIATRLHRALLDRKVPVFFMDGDEMRSGLCADLTFTTSAREENHRRAAEVAKLAVEQNLMNVVISTMAPQHSQRDVVAKVLGNRLVWIYVHAPLDVCVKRDPKGLYHREQKRELGNLLNFPFDTPRPHEREHFVDTVAQNAESAAQSVLEVVQVQLSDFMI
jgi:adenylylsulfate kinase-like enzyme